MNKLSKRLSIIASLVPCGARVCDIGTDHGYLSIFLSTSGKASKIIATDISPLPLENARKNIVAANVTDIELRLCNGLSGIKHNEVDTVIIAGMGGEVIAEILKSGSNITKDKDIRIILQPTTSPEHLRRFLYKNGYGINEDIPIFENGKLYSVMSVSYKGGVTNFEEYCCFTGLVSPDTEDGRLYLEKQQLRAFKCMTALESIEQKRDEYLYYKGIYEGITNYLTEK